MQIRRVSKEVMQRIANPSRAVRFRYPPPINWLLDALQRLVLLFHGHLLAGRAAATGSGSFRINHLTCFSNRIGRGVGTILLDVCIAQVRLDAFGVAFGAFNTAFAYG